MKAIEIMNSIFESNVTEESMDMPIGQAVDWDSYMIMNFLSEIADQYNVDIDVEEVMMVEQVKDLINLIQKYIKGLE